ncbi:hypothetical protein [Halorubrum sp. DTA46]|uniref:hypothetical protein n=1 Tax=Halorubrum sp. DTA46 TaxID=3402162 RepID=UPI003AAC55C8
MKALLLLVAGLVGLIETLAPRQIVSLWTRLMYRDAADAEPRGWLPVAARIEGAILVCVALVGLFRLATVDDDPEADGSLVDATS